MVCVDAMQRTLIKHVIIFPSMYSTCLRTYACMFVCMAACMHTCLHVRSMYYYYYYYLLCAVMTTVIVTIITTTSNAYIIFPGNDMSNGDADAKRRKVGDQSAGHDTMYNTM